MTRCRQVTDCGQLVLGSLPRPLHSLELGDLELTREKLQAAAAASAAPYQLRQCILLLRRP